MRDHYEYKEALFTNSLFMDYLLDNGLNTYKDESTRDIICIEFNYGSRSYQEEQVHLQKVAREAKIEFDRAKLRGDKIAMNKASNKMAKVIELFKLARENRNNYHKYSADELRTMFYNDGIDVKYITRNRNGDIRKEEIFHYRMLFRSTGKAKKGSCMFIKDRLYKKSLNYIRMGIDLDKNPMIVEISAYSPLISSGIVGRVQIDPKNILVLKDVDRYFKTNVVAIKTDDEKHCYAEHINDYELKNTMFDGQALIDSSIFPEWGNGYILLRQHFCKMAAFNSNIQQFYKDYFGDKYETAIVKDMWGNEHYAKDVQLITTDNAMKWIKFDKSYDYWCEWVGKNNNNFGVVKTAHPSKLGNNQKMSYQMVNSLSCEVMDDVMATSVSFVNKLKEDDVFFLEYLKNNDNFSNDFSVLVALCEHNSDFVRSTYFRQRKKDIIKSYVLNMKSGEIMNSADNLTVVGSPYAQLLYSASGIESDVDNDNTFSFESGTIQCYTERFDNNEFLAFFRSPFNSKNNLTYLHNVYSENMSKYFNLGRQCIAINMNGTDAQDRNNGMDQDSDFGYTTNQSSIVNHAKYCYENYPTIVNMIPKESNSYKNTMDDFANVDNKLSKSQTDIGESSNLAQIAQTYDYSFDESKFADYVCVLSVLAQVAIDNAKRTFDINLTEEIRRIKKDMNVSKNKYPKFWKIIKKGFSKRNINNNLICPMNSLANLELMRFRNKKSTLPISDFFIKNELNIDRRKCKRVEKLISDYALDFTKYVSSDEIEYNDWLLLRSDFDSLLDSIKETYISNNYSDLMSWIIDRAFLITPQMRSNINRIDIQTQKNRSLLLKVLYNVSPKSFLKCFKMSKNVYTEEL